MSIVIKGLSKPNSCYGCFLVREQTLEVGYCPLLKREVRNFKECPNDCPIEPIDLKPLKNDLQEYINEQMEDGEFEKEFNKQRKRFEKIRAKIKKQK